MKISKIPGLGRFGVFIDDVDFDNITDDEWMEIGKIHLDSLVTIIRNTGLDPDRYNELMLKWGNPRGVKNFQVYKQYGFASGKEFYERCFAEDPTIEKAHREWGKQLYRFSYRPALLRVSGKLDEDGNPIGMFAEGELLWHSNESGNLTFTPGVSLLGQEKMIGSSTGFVTTVDWYEAQSESFRSELDEMVVIHKFTPGKINPGLREEQDLLVRNNMCAEDNTEIPLVIDSPGGYSGLHFSVNTMDRIVGMTKEESDKIFEHIGQGIFTEENIYDHWYEHDDDLMLFDNSITLHRRLGDNEGRLAYRVQYDYETILDKPWMPYRQEPYRSQYIEQITEQVEFMGPQKSRFKLPTIS